MRTNEEPLGGIPIQNRSSSRYYIPLINICQHVSIAWFEIIQWSTVPRQYTFYCYANVSKSGFAWLVVCIAGPENLKHLFHNVSAIRTSVIVVHTDFGPIILVCDISLHDKIAWHIQCNIISTYMYISVLLLYKKVYCWLRKKSLLFTRL